MMIAPVISPQALLRTASNCLLPRCLIPGAVEELMRRHQIANVARIVVKDTVLGGVSMKAGDMVLLED